jgi:predicted RNA-binding protein (TIGR00451 family)
MTLLHYDEELLRSLGRVYGDELPRFLESLLRPGSRLYARVNVLRVDPGELVDRLRMRNIEVYRDEELPEAIYFRIYGPYKVGLKDKVVVVDKETAESVVLGANVYAPGVIKCYYDVRVGDEVTVVTRNGFPVAEGVLTTDCHEAIKRRRGVVVEVHRSLYRTARIRDLPEFSEGLIYPQSLPAMYVARILDPGPGDLVVDLCAAPGGKTGHVVEISRGRVHIIAFDRSKNKVGRMVKELSRLGHLPYVETWVADTRYVHEDFPWIRADKVLVDPPCSALGVRPKLGDRKTYRDILTLRGYQAQFLRAASRILKPGGTIVYSTCTVTLEENEEVVEEIIEEERCLEVSEVRIGRALGGAYGHYRNSYTRFHPHIHDTPGYFIAKLTKKC